MTDKMSVADFFCGAGGFSEGFRQAGFDVVFGLDNWEPARQTHKLNHPKCLHPGLECHFETKGDILAITPDRINEIVPDTDIIIGSPPCVSFSSSNKAGKADKTLGLELVHKMLQIIAVKKHKPKSMLKYWLMENVPNSRKFIKTEYTFKMLGLDNITLKNIGLKKKENDVALKISISDDNIFNAVHYEVPQKRERFICGEFPMPSKKTPEKGEWINLGKIITALNHKTKDIIDPNYEFMIKNEDLTDHFYDTIIPPIEWQEAMIKKQQARYYGKMSFPEDEKQPSRTIMATRSVLSRESMILPNGSPGNFRAPTVREVASIMSFPITYQFQGNNEATKYRLVGNSVCPKLSYALAEAILHKHKKKVLSLHNTKTDKNKLQVDLRHVNPPKKMPRDKHPLANFAETVPDTKYKNFRVDLDNGLPKSHNGKIRWTASVHHATGNKSMKKAIVSNKNVMRLLNKTEDKKRVKAFYKEVKKIFSGKITKASEFQKQHCLVENNKKKMTPREALSKIRLIVEKNFPKDRFEKVMLDNTSKSKEIIKFDNGNIPENKIPIRIVAALYACNHIVNLTK